MKRPKPSNKFRSFDDILNDIVLLKLLQKQHRIYKGKRRKKNAFLGGDHAFADRDL